MLSGRLAVVRTTPTCLLSALGRLVFPLALIRLLSVPSTGLSRRSALMVGGGTRVGGQRVCLVLQLPLVVDLQCLG